MKHLIKKMLKEDIESHLDGIVEALNNPINVTLNKTDYGYEGNFDIDKNHYLITIEDMTENDCCFIFKFSMNNSFDLVNDVRKAFSVIPTIRNVVETFIETHKPKLFIFNKSDSSKGRERVYNEFSDELSKKYGYNRSVRSIDNNVLYMLSNNLDKDNYLTSLEYLLKNYGDFTD